MQLSWNVSVAEFRGIILVRGLLIPGLDNCIQSASIIINRPLTNPSGGGAVRKRNHGNILVTNTHISPRAPKNLICQVQVHFVIVDGGAAAGGDAYGPSFVRSYYKYTRTHFVNGTPAPRRRVCGTQIIIYFGGGQTVLVGPNIVGRPTKRLAFGLVGRRAVQSSSSAIIQSHNLHSSPATTLFAEVNRTEPVV